MGNLEDTEERLAREVIAVLEGSSRALAKRWNFIGLPWSQVCFDIPTSLIIVNVLPGVTSLVLNLVALVVRIPRHIKSRPSTCTWWDFKNSFDIPDPPRY